MSLSTWFRDYVYIPLGGNRVSRPRWSFNILIVFLLSGIWHGANWTFLFWGLYHAILMILSRLTQGIRSGAARRLGIDAASSRVATFNVIRTFVLVSIGWVLFRAPSIEAARVVFRTIIVDWRSFLTPERLMGEVLGYRWHPIDLYVTLLAIVVLELGDTFQSYGSVRAWLSRRPLLVRWCAYYSLGLFILFFGRFNGPPFIYFQF
jgi:hypothetical protein